MSHLQARRGLRGGAGGGPYGSIAWTRIQTVLANAGSTPWDFSSIDLSGAGSTATLASSSPLPYEGAGYIKFACDGSDGANGRARGMVEPASWTTQQYLRTTFALFLPTGFSTTLPAGGTMQAWKFDCFPTVNNSVSLLYFQTNNTWKLFVKDNNVDSDITGTFTLSENAWHRIEIQLRLSSAAAGWALVYRDGTLVASAQNVKTVYAADNGSGHKIPYIRYGLAAHGTGQVSATAVHIDACTVDRAL